MSGITLFPSGGTNQNLNNSYEPGGFASDGSPTLITPSATANVKGSYATVVASTAAAWSGFQLFVMNITSSASRVFLDIKINGVVVVPNLYTMPSTQTDPTQFTFPIPVAAGSLIEIDAQSSGATQTFYVAIEGILSNSQSAPGFTVCEHIGAIDLTTTRLNTTVNYGSTASWAALTASSSAAYGAIMPMIGPTGGAVAVTQPCAYLIGTGAAASEVEFYRCANWMGATTTNGVGFSPFTVPRTIPISTRIAMAALQTTPGTNAVRVGAFGFR